MSCSLRGWGKHLAPTSYNLTQGAIQVLSVMFVGKMLEFELLQGRSRAFVSLLPSRGSHPNMRRRNLNGEA